MLAAMSKPDPRHAAALLVASVSPHSSVCPIAGCPAPVSVGRGVTATASDWHED
jgi:hypothetical protein